MGGVRSKVIWAAWVKILKSWYTKIEILSFVLNGGRGAWKVKENRDQENETEFLKGKVTSVSLE